MAWKPKELRSVVAVSGAALVVGVTALMSAVVGSRSEGQLEREIGRSLSEAAFQMAEKLDTDMWARSNQVSVLAKIDAVRDWAVAQKVVDELKAKDHTLAWVGALDKDGRVMASSGGILLGANASSRPVFQNGVKGHFVGDVHDAVMLAKLLPNPTGEPMKFVDVATPLRDENGNTVGVFATHFSWNWAREVQQTLLRPMRDRRSLETFIVSADNTVLLGPEGAQGHPLSLKSVADARTAGTGWAVETWPDGKAYVTGYANSPGHADYPGLGWTVLARQPVETAYADATALRREILLWGAAFAVLFSAAAWFAAGWIARPLRAIADAAIRLRRGEPGVEIPEVTGAAEVVDLSRSLRALVASLSDTQHALSRMEDAAYQDRLTGLPNRRFFEQYAEALANRPGTQPFTVLCLDLDGFKPVNDSLGHQAGDAVLRQVGARLASCLRAEDVVARLGGDEFVIVINPVPGKKAPRVEEIAQRLIEAVNEPVLVSGRVARVGCSIGMASWPEHGATLMHVLEKADQALYAAKRAGRNRAVGIGDGASEEPAAALSL
ncbi:sensor domain-containing diguanylate cyclase [Azospirillum sp.]|uniref:sensor domain-containing diguanylate cyclase n=1 Tax=Azospirillum sp. TaxID=34012 RepID=UPI002D3C0293|nr:diguanylate cyclase [Azospirillum sp.]HYD66644.1 diguanylate cyclase [Azospirillum sp.]